VLAIPSIGEELIQQAFRGKIQAALQMKDYAGVDRQTTELRSGSPKVRLAATCGECSPARWSNARSSPRPPPY